VVTQLPQVDHIVPLRHGGTDDLTNLQTLCLRCHGRKTVAEMAAA
jgi:5-methylcytosine-specific restriction protein A